MNKAERTFQPEVASHYIRVRWFKKGTGHLTFLRADLVTRMNEILSRHFPDALPPPH